VNVAEVRSTVMTRIMDSEAYSHDKYESSDLFHLLARLESRSSDGFCRTSASAMPLRRSSFRAKTRCSHSRGPSMKWHALRVLTRLLNSALVHRADPHRRAPASQLCACGTSDTFPIGQRRIHMRSGAKGALLRAVRCTHKRMHGVRGAIDGHAPATDGCGVREGEVRGAGGRRGEAAKGKTVASASQISADIAFRLPPSPAQYGTVVAFM